MKKKLALATLFMTTAMVATGCDDSVTLKKDDNGQYIIFSLNNNGTNTNYTAEDLLGDMLDGSSATATLYNEVARQVFTQYAEKTLTEAQLTSILNTAKDEVNDFKESCKTNAKNDSKDYDTYLEEALEKEGVETIGELRELYYYNGLKKEIEEDFVENNYNFFLDKYLDTYTPFQVKHILVAANSSSVNYADGKMTTDNARKLLSILNKFVAGDSFADIAKFTDDTSSAANGGVMPFNQAQNYVHEFRYATYVQEIFENNTDLDSRYAAANDLHIINSDPTSKDYVDKTEFEESNLYQIYKNGVGYVSLSNIMKLDEPVSQSMAGAYNYYENGTLKAGLTADDLPTVAEQNYEMNVDKYDCTGKLNESYYQEFELERNKIFNSTLNSHKLQYIELDGTYASMTKNSTTVNGKKVLADDAGNPIFVALASTGIHFMSMVWNSYNPVGTDVTNPYLSDEAKTSLQKINSDYNKAYFTLYDTDSDLSKDLSNYKYTYIGQNGAYATKSGLTSASDSLLSDITSYVSNVEYYLFDAIAYDSNSNLVADFNYTIKFANDKENKLYDAVKDYIDNKVTSTNDTFASEVQSTCETYGSMLAREKEVKQAAENWKVYAGWKLYRD